MKHIHYLDEEPEEITVAGAKGVRLRTVIGEKDGAPNFCMRVISFDQGGQSPNHSHGYEHEMYITKGRGTAKIEGKTVDLKPGDVLYIPANVDHCIGAIENMEMV
jgi:quercetin dioxygenase-like cupin family protein